MVINLHSQHKFSIVSRQVYEGVYIQNRLLSNIYFLNVLRNLYWNFVDDITYVGMCQSRLPCCQHFHHFECQHRKISGYVSKIWIEIVYRMASFKLVIATSFDEEQKEQNQRQILPPPYKLLALRHDKLQNGVDTKGI